MVLDLYLHATHRHEVNIIKIKKFIGTELGACTLAEAGGLLEPRGQHGFHNLKNKQLVFQIKLLSSEKQQKNVELVSVSVGEGHF